MAVSKTVTLEPTKIHISHGDKTKGGEMTFILESGSSLEMAKKLNTIATYLKLTKHCTMTIGKADGLKIVWSKK